MNTIVDDILIQIQKIEKDLEGLRTLISTYKGELLWEQIAQENDKNKRGRA